MGSCCSKKSEHDKAEPLLNADEGDDEFVGSSGSAKYSASEHGVQEGSSHRPASGRISTAGGSFKRTAADGVGSSTAGGAGAGAGAASAADGVSTLPHSATGSASVLVPAAQLPRGSSTASERPPSQAGVSSSAAPGTGGSSSSGSGSGTGGAAAATSPVKHPGMSSAAAAPPVPTFDPAVLLRIVEAAEEELIDVHATAADVEPEDPSDPAAQAFTARAAALAVNPALLKLGTLPRPSATLSLPDAVIAALTPPQPAAVASRLAMVDRAATAVAAARNGMQLRGASEAAVVVTV